MLQGVHLITSGSGVASMLPTHPASMQGYTLRCTAQCPVVPHCVMHPFGYRPPPPGLSHLSYLSKEYPGSHERLGCCPW